MGSVLIMQVIIKIIFLLGAICYKNRHHRTYEIKMDTDNNLYWLLRKTGIIWPKVTPVLAKSTIKKNIVYGYCMYCTYTCMAKEVVVCLQTTQRKSVTRRQSGRTQHKTKNVNVLVTWLHYCDFSCYHDFRRASVPISSNQWSHYRKLMKYAEWNKIGGALLSTVVYGNG